VLIYTSCRKKQDSKKQKESKENQGFSQDEPENFLQKLNLENQRSNNTQTLKILEKKFF